MRTMAKWGYARRLDQNPSMLTTGESGPFVVGAAESGPPVLVRRAQSSVAVIGVWPRSRFFRRWEAGSWDGPKRPGPDPVQHQGLYPTRDERGETGSRLRKDREMDETPDRLYGWGYAGHSVDDLVAFAQTHGVHAVRLREGDEVVDGVARIPPAVQPVRGVVHAPILSQETAPTVRGRGGSSRPHRHVRRRRGGPSSRSRVRRGARGPPHTRTTARPTSTSPNVTMRPGRSSSSPDRRRGLL